MMTIDIEKTEKCQYCDNIAAYRFVGWVSMLSEDGYIDGQFGYAFICKKCKQEMEEHDFDKTPWHGYEYCEEIGPIYHSIFDR